MQTSIKVLGMSCGHCKGAVEKAVKAVAGVSGVEVDLKQALVAVTFDEGVTNVEQIKAAISDAGYEPQ